MKKKKGIACASLGPASIACVGGVLTANGDIYNQIDMIEYIRTEPLAPPQSSSSVRQKKTILGFNIENSKVTLSKLGKSI